MKWKAFTPLAIAVVLGLLAARVATKMVSPTEIKVAAAADLTPIIVAARDIEPGVTLGELDVTTAKVETLSLPAGVFTLPGQTTGKVVRVGMIKGQAVLPNLLAEEGAGYGVGATLPKGMRAITMDINDTTGVAGFIMPQGRVDVVTTMQINGKQTAKTLMESVQVLAVGSRTNPATAVDPQVPQSRTVTLLVKPKDAERLELALSTSRVRLLLRNGRDVTLAQSDGITLADLEGHHDTDPFAAGKADVMNAADHGPTTQPTAMPTSWTVQVIKGGQVSKQSFDLPTAASDAPAPTPAEKPETNAVTNIDTNDVK